MEGRVIGGQLGNVTLWLGQRALEPASGHPAFSSSTETRLHYLYKWSRKFKSHCSLFLACSCIQVVCPPVQFTFLMMFCLKAVFSIQGRWPVKHWEMLMGKVKLIWKNMHAECP